jgi:hypothetical protein
MGRAVVVLEGGVITFVALGIIAAALNPDFRAAVIAPYRTKARSLASNAQQPTASAGIGADRRPALRRWRAAVGLLVLITAPLLFESIVLARATPTIQLSYEQELELGRQHSAGDFASCPSAVQWFEGDRPGVCRPPTQRNGMLSLLYLAGGLVGADLTVRAVRRRRRIDEQWLADNALEGEPATGADTADVPEWLAWKLLLKDAAVVLLLVWVVSYTYQIVHLRDTATHRLGVSSGETVECTRRFAPRMTCWVPWDGGGPYIRSKITVWATGFAVIGRVPHVFMFA